jgi:hypothetical protein
VTRSSARDCALTATAMSARSSRIEGGFRIVPHFGQESEADRETRYVSPVFGTEVATLRLTRIKPEAL